MLHTIDECRGAARQLTSHKKQFGARRGVEKFHEGIHKLLRNGEIKPEYLALSTLYEGLVPNGREMLESFKPGYRPSGSLMREAGDNVDTSAFSGIIGQVTYTTVLDALQSPDFFALQLVDTEPATTQGPELVPGISMIGDRAEEVGEGETYPPVTLSEEYITIPRKPKDGFRIDVTEEATWEDKTGGLLMRRANAAAESMGITMEKQGLDTFFGLSTNNLYSRNGATGIDTYGDSSGDHDWDNLSASTAFVDFTDIEAAVLLFDDIVDPNTGEPVLLNGAMDIIVPTALEMTLSRALSATEVRFGDVIGSTVVPQTVAPNPLAGYRRTFTPRTSQYVKNRTGSASTWFVGDFRGAFGYREVWPLQVFRQDSGSVLAFDRDIITSVKVRRKGIFYNKEPRKVIKCTA